MKAILSYQNTKSNGRDILVINGEMSEYRGSNEQKEAQKFTMPIEGMRPQKLWVWWFQKKGASPSLRLYYQKHKGVLLVSNLLSIDEVGRRMVYTFYSDDVNKPLYVRKLMEDYCSISGVKPNPKDSNALEHLLLFHKNKKKYVFISVTAVLLLLALCIIL